MADRRRELGTGGEEAAAGHLVRAGYRILARNYRTRAGELDLVALDGRCLVFCEVKTRVATARGAAGALESIGPAKRARVRRMAAEWLASEAPSLPPGARPDIRFDVIGVALTCTGALVALHHVEGAF